MTKQPSVLTLGAAIAPLPSADLKAQPNGQREANGRQPLSSVLA